MSKLFIDVGVAQWIVQSPPKWTAAYSPLN